MNSLMEAIGPVFVLLVFAYMLKLYLDYRLRRKLIDAGQVDERIKYLFFSKDEAYAPSSLKWGLVLLGLGLAIIIARLLPYKWYETEISISLMFVFAGAGLLVYYFIADQRAKKHREAEKISPPNPDPNHMS
ncbi:MAG: hypothetical protein JW763_01990 [candidate division Zixibacteria bacterium]|nr:hypothetical protein [candidate division Zixibacteria bacterium]